MHRRCLTLAGALLLASCARPAPPGLVPEQTRPPLALGGQRVLVLPFGLAAGAFPERIDAEFGFALEERNTSVEWISADELRAVLRRSPGVAPDPGVLPQDPLLHHGERRAIEPLASTVRRYAALVDARWVLLPRGAGWTEDTAGSRALRLGAALLDARTGNVLWWGAVERAADGDPGTTLPRAAAELAARLVLPSTPSIEPPPSNDGET